MNMNDMTYKPKLVELEPTVEMIEAGAQGLVHWEGDCVWPVSWSPIQVTAARTEAERVWRSMWLAAVVYRGDEMSDTPSNAEMIDSNHMRIDGKIYRVVDPDILAYITKLERENAALHERIEKMEKVVDAAIAWRHLGQIRDLPNGESNLAALARLDVLVREYEESK